jgi:ABC-2 type transport system ATP-binding protein
MATDMVIETRGLSKAFGKAIALADLDLEVRPGRVLGYLGANGAGKSTTIKLVTGLWRPTAGSARVFGHDATCDRDLVQGRFGYLPGDFVGYPGMTGQQLLHLLASLRGGVRQARVDELRERFDVDLDRRIGTLSHGNRQKVGILQAFMHEPELLILDEPTIGLDPLMQREFLTLVREVRAAGTTVLLSSHILSEVAAVADDVAVIDSGRLVVHEPVGQLRARAPRRAELIFRTEVPALLRHLPGVTAVTTDGPRASVTHAGSVVPLVEALAGQGLLDVVSHEPDLADVFLGLYDGKGASSDDQRVLEGALGTAS